MLLELVSSSWTRLNSSPSACHQTLQNLMPYAEASYGIFRAIYYWRLCLAAM